MRVVPLKAWREACRDLLSSGNKDAKRVAFDRAVKALLEVGQVFEHNGGYYGVAPPGSDSDGGAS